MPKQTSVGCAFLNRASNLNAGGWASLDGGAPFKFSDLETLREAGGLWVVSTPEKTFLTEGGSGIKFLRHANFLATPITAIAEEVSPGASSLNNIGISVQRVSEIVSRVTNLAETLSPMAPVLAQHDSIGRSLVHAIQATVAPSLRDDPLPLDLTQSLPSLFAPSAPLGNSEGRSAVVRIPANRIELQRLVLARGVPGRVWTEVKKDAYPNVLSWAIGDNIPIIAKVSLKGPQPKVKSNVPFMASLTRGAVRWMALPEIVSLSKIVEMRAEKIFMAQDLVTSLATLKVPPPEFAPAGMASISAGLLAEAYLHAVCAPSFGSSEQRFEGQGVQMHSIRAAWLTAVSKSIMLNEALELLGAGFSVIGYGLSHILVAVSNRNLRSLRKAIGPRPLLSYPTGLRIQESAYEESIETHEGFNVGDLKV